MHIDAIDHFVLTVRDLEVTVAFYTRVLGMEAITFGADRRALAFGVQKINLHEAGREFEPKAAAPTPGSADLFRNDLNENAAAWDALGDAYHKRLERNYVTWVRRYVAGDRILRNFTVDELRRRPVAWTIGGLTPAARFFSNVVAAHSAGIPIGLLMCKHFPQVSVPEVLADHIRKAARA